MRNLLIISIWIFISGCYATQSKPQAFLAKIYLNGNQIRVDPKRIITKFLYDSLDYRIRYGIRNDPNMLNRGHLFYQMQNYIQQQLDSSFPLAAKVAIIDTGLGNIDFDSIFLFSGKRFRSEYKFEFHRSPYWPIYTRFDSVWLSPNYSHLSNTLVVEFKLLKMYRSGRGGAPHFESEIQLRFGYIDSKNKVGVYRNFLIIGSRVVPNGRFYTLGNENIDWWRPRHIDELMKRMQYELGITDKKGRTLPVQ
jgi:hypothetical protein